MKDIFNGGTQELLQNTENWTNPFFSTGQKTRMLENMYKYFHYSVNVELWKILHVLIYKVRETDKNHHYHLYPHDRNSLLSRFIDNTFSVNELIFLPLFFLSFVDWYFYTSKKVRVLPQCLRFAALYVFPVFVV